MTTKPVTLKKEQAALATVLSRSALELFHGNKTKAAKSLGISRLTLRKYLKGDE